MVDNVLINKDPEHAMHKKDQAQSHAPWFFVGIVIFVGIMLFACTPTLETTSTWREEKRGLGM